MIIVIGEKDELLMKDASAYIRQCGKNFYFDGRTSFESAKKLDADCQNISKRIWRALGVIIYDDGTEKWTIRRKIKRKLRKLKNGLFEKMKSDEQ